MGSSSKSCKTPPTAKARSQKRHRNFLQISVSTSSRNDTSIFDDMTDMERVLAFSYYYDHPEELPDRESGAARRARQKPLKIKVKFDEAIFERQHCKRPIAWEELEEIDPMSTGSPASSVSDEDELFKPPPLLEIWKSPVFA
ncbi:hypothetical protein PRZ48_008573 [Zasmidium cellare]|uniref:Uncharacterized protein n=1 Tax=Zasmidium cellare TaxID=395010 RepID=A0ABR0EG87_ZASCE|nr:hypothetical protein PRZ48_008573 [Zasmidium cellare]